MRRQRSRFGLAKTIKVWPSGLSADVFRFAVLDTTKKRLNYVKANWKVRKMPVAAECART